MTKDAAETTVSSPRSSLQARFFDFGGFILSLRSTDPELLELAQLRYGAFAVSRGGQFDLVYQVTPDAPRRDEIGNSEFADIAIHSESDQLVLDGSHFSVTVDFATGRAKLRGPCSTFPIDVALRHLLAYLRADMLIVHGGTLVTEGRAWWVTGPSGCGKSTLAGLLPEYALCDELSAVDLANETMRLHSLPFWHARPGCGVLQGIYVLEHGLEDHRVRLSVGHAVQVLSQQIVWPLADHTATESCFQNLTDLVAKVPVWRLSFRPTRDIWGLIEQSE